MAKGVGVPCGASYINKDKKCRVGVPSAVANVLNRASEEVGARSLIAAAGAHGGHGAKRKAHHVAAVLRNKLGGNIVRGEKGRLLKRALEKKGLLPVEEPVARAGDIFNKNVVPAKDTKAKEVDNLKAQGIRTEVAEEMASRAGKPAAAPSVPSALRRQLQGLAAVDQQVPAKGSRTVLVDKMIGHGLKKEDAEKVVDVARRIKAQAPPGSLTQAKKELSDIQGAGVAAAVAGRQTSFAKNVDRQEIARAKIEEIEARRAWSAADKERDALPPGGGKKGVAKIHELDDKINAAVERHERAVEKVDRLVAANKGPGDLTRAKKEEANAIADHQALVKERIALAKVKNPTAQARKKVLDKELLAGVARIDKAKEDVAAQGGVAKTDATGNTVWARSDAGDFDNDFKILKRVRGTADMIDWNETVKHGTKIGQGAFGTVIMDKAGNYVVKRGDVSSDEADIIRKVGEAGLGPKLIVAELASRKDRRYGKDIHNGRVAMEVAAGEPIGERSPEYKIGGVRVADAYWRGRANLHRLGIAHNDMHIENVFVDEKGKAHMLDMGLAQDSSKAALAEAMGAFDPPTKGRAESIRGAGGGADWQVRRWAGTGGELLERVNRGQMSQNDWAEVTRKAPVMRQVIDNKPAVVYEMKRDGFTDNDINTIMSHGIRSPIPTYEQGPWSRMSGDQAMRYINLLYEGV